MHVLIVGLYGDGTIHFFVTNVCFLVNPGSLLLVSSIMDEQHSELKFKCLVCYVLVGTMGLVLKKMYYNKWHSGGTQFANVTALAVYS